MVSAQPFPPFGLAFVQYVHLLTSEQQLELEAKTVSSHSPGPVHDAELVVRAIDQPLHFSDGEFTPAAFTDCASVGMSVDRLEHCTEHQAWAGAEARLHTWHINRIAAGKARTERQVLALVVFAVAELRAMRLIVNSKPERALGVFDTAKPENVAHADVVILVAGKPAERSLRHSFYAAAKRDTRFRLASAPTV